MQLPHQQLWLQAHLCLHLQLLDVQPLQRQHHSLQLLVVLLHVLLLLMMLVLMLLLLQARWQVKQQRVLWQLRPWLNHCVHRWRCGAASRGTRVC